MTIDDLDVGDRVMIDSCEGFGGPATVVAVRNSKGARLKVRMDDGNPPEFWAHDFEVTPEARGEEGYDSRRDTRKHIRQVQALLGSVIDGLDRRRIGHDLSKLESPEVEVFDEFTPKLAATTYGSDEYKAFLAAMKPALDHHYAANSHHPEYFAFEFGQLNPEIVANGEAIRGMNLLDLVEMLCDWKAATLRHNDGDIRRSIEINQKRFGYSDELKRILLNTLPAIGGV